MGSILSILVSSLIIPYLKERLNLILIIFFYRLGPADLEYCSLRIIMNIFHNITHPIRKPHSLSYQAEIFPILIPTTLVKDASTIDEAGLWLKSIETNFS